MVFTSREFSHEIFDSITIIYDGGGNIYSIGDQVSEKLECNIKEIVPEEFIISLGDIKRYGNVDIGKLVPEKYNKENTIILKEPGIHILAASSSSPLAREFCVWLFSEIFPRIRGSPYHSVFY